MTQSKINNQQSKIKKWLPDRDLNPDKQNQNLSCYRYTIGQLRPRI